MSLIIFICIINVRDINFLPNLQLIPTNYQRHAIPFNISDESFNKLDFYLTKSDVHISTNPSLPALAIIGPAKTSTTSIYYSLIRTYSNWHQQQPLKDVKGDPFEATFFIQFTLKSILQKHRKRLVNRKTILFIANKLPICNISAPISRFPFFELLSIVNQTALHKIIIEYVNIFMRPGHSVLTDYDYEAMHYQYTIDKTPMNFYLPHVALIFGYYFSYKNILQNVRGLKVLCVLRNPYKRYRSWFSQNCAGLKHSTAKEQFWSVFNQTAIKVVDEVMANVYVRKFRDMIVARNDEFDDSQIILEWFKWYYGVMGYALHKFEHGFFASLYYPQLLVYIHFYQQLGLLDGDRRMFKVISFDYVIGNGDEALHLIQCWVRFGLDDLETCLQADKLPNTHRGNVSALRKLNSKALRFPDAAKNKLIQYFEPIKVKVDQLLYKYGNVILGEFDGLQSLLH